MQVPAEVSATAGEAAVLPCTFTHPHRHYDGPLTAIWRAGEPFTGPQVFRCAAARGSELCQTALSLHGRFRLLGNPRRNDLSLRIERLALADDGRYFCRVEFAGDVHDRYESRQGVRLRVTGERAARLRSPRPAGLSVRGLGWDPRGYNGHIPSSRAVCSHTWKGHKPPGNWFRGRGILAPGRAGWMEPGMGAAMKLVVSECAPTALRPAGRKTRNKGCSGPCSLTGSQGAHHVPSTSLDPEV